MIDKDKYADYLASIGITEPEDIENCIGVCGIEIRTMYEDGDEHEGYYSTIDEAIDALEELRKIFPHLSK